MPDTTSSPHKLDKNASLESSTGSLKSVDEFISSSSMTGRPKKELATSHGKLTAETPTGVNFEDEDSAVGRDESRRREGKFAHGNGSSDQRDADADVHAGKGRGDGDVVDAGSGKVLRKKTVWVDVGEVDADGRVVSGNGNENGDGDEQGPEGRAEGIKHENDEQGDGEGGVKVANAKRERPPEDHDNVPKFDEHTKGNGQPKNKKVKLEDHLETETASPSPTNPAEQSAIAISPTREALTTSKSSILEMGHIYFFYRPKVSVPEPKSLGDVQRSYILLRPLPSGAKFKVGEGGRAGGSEEGGGYGGEVKKEEDMGGGVGKEESVGVKGTPRPLEDEGRRCRLLAVPKKKFPAVGGHERLLTIVDKANCSIEEIKETVLKGSDYQTKT